MCATGISIVLRIKLETWDRLEEETMPAFMAVLRDASSGVVFVGFEIFISRAWNRQGQAVSCGRGDDCRGESWEKMPFCEGKQKGTLYHGCQFYKCYAYLQSLSNKCFFSMRHKFV
ncbi:hypothetical protein TNCV_279911 [Trichonephila clavipes]|nr:hypothetical protein TNCV_279911 [Trichonephila clavipes]